MEYIRVTKENLDQEHICCAISNNKDVQVASKKAWLLDRFEDGLVFLMEFYVVRLYKRLPIGTFICSQ